MKKTEDFIREMEHGNVLMAREFTFNEYATELRQFQDIVCKMVTGDQYYDGMRIDEALFLMESAAREKGLRKNPAVHNGILAMKQLKREMAITMSGIKGENMVSRTLEFLDRPNTRIFRNVYVTGGLDETELDVIVLTDSSVIILETKKVKSDLTLTEDGRMVFTGDECYDKIPLCEKMALKRRLLRKHLEKVIVDKELNIPVHVDSFIVFSAPKGRYIRVDNKYRKEKYCFRTNLNQTIKNYVGYTSYESDQVEQLGEIFSEMESNVKRFEAGLDYDEIRRSLAEAMVVLQGEAVIQKTSAPKPADAKIIDLEAKRIQLERKKKVCAAAGFGCAVASVFAGVMLSGAATMLGMASAISK